MNAPATILRPYLGGSDVAAVLGLSPWKTPLALYEEKRRALAGEGEPDRDSVVKRRGKRWESVALEMLVEALGERDITASVLYTNTRSQIEADPWMRAEIDAELLVKPTGAVWNAEIKTVSPFNVKEWGDPETDEIPTHYAAQVQWGLMVNNRNTCVVGALFGADVMKPYIVERDEAVIDWLRAGAIDFWQNHVLAGVPPKPMTVGDLDRLYPKARDAIVVADPAVTKLALRYRALEAEVKARTAEQEALEFEIRQFMGDAALLALTPDGKPAFQWKDETGPFLDQTRLKADYPDAHKACLTKWSKRVFRFKGFDAKGVLG